MSRSPLFAAAALAVLLSACGTEEGNGTESGSSPSTDEAPFVVTASGEVEVSCGAAEGWVPSVMAEGVQDVLSDDEVAGIFQDILRDPATGEEAAMTLFRDGVDVEWRVLRDDGDTLLLGLGRWAEQGPVGEGAYYLGLEREGDSWRPGGWGDCQLSPVLEQGNAWAEMTDYRGAPESATLTAQVHERDCASGRDPEPFLHEPYVVETADSVTIYWTSEPPSGSQDCQGNPPVDRIVELEQPLGTRLVFDGFSYPPREVRQH